MDRKEWSNVLQYAHPRRSRLMICMVRILLPLGLVVSYALVSLGVIRTIRNYIPEERGVDRMHESQFTVPLWANVQREIE